MMEKCPWGQDNVQEDGSVRHRRLVSNTGGLLYEEPCAFCGGSNLYADWMKHPEYARQVKAGLRREDEDTRR